MSYVHDTNDLTPQMAGYSDGTNVVSATSEYTGYESWKAFNHAAGSSIWLTFSLPTVVEPQIITFDFGAGNAHKFTSCKITNIGAAAGVGDLDNPRDWLIQGCADGDDPAVGGNWHTLDTQTDVDWVIDETKEFSWVNTTSYRYFRMYITDANLFSYPYLAVAEIEVFAAPPPPVVTVFILPATAALLDVGITTFTVTGAPTSWILKETSDPPALDDVGWLSSPPTSYTFGSVGSKTLYAWAKNDNGLSNSLNDSVVITFVPTPIVGFINATYSNRWPFSGNPNIPYATDRCFGVFVYNGEVYVVATDNNRICVYDLLGNNQRRWGQSGGGDGDLSDPSQVFVYDDEVYVIETSGQRVSVFDTQGTFQRKWGTAGAGDSNFAYPQGICVYNDDVYIADSVNNRICVWDKAGTGLIHKFGSAGTQDGQFTGDSNGSSPIGIVVFGDEVYTCDSGGDRVQVFALDGTFKRKFGSHGSGDGQFDRPTYIWVVNNVIFVSDSNNTRVQAFDLDGGFQFSFGSNGTDPGQFPLSPDGNPFGIHYYAASGSLYVVSVRYGISIFALSAPWPWKATGTGTSIISNWASMGTGTAVNGQWKSE